MTKPLPPTTAAAHEAGHALDRGAAAREHLMAQATRIFAAKGFAGASTREICDAAGVNVAAIHYYFGDKEGLYRAVLARPLAEMMAGFGRFDDPALALEDALGMFLAPFLDMVACSDPDDLEAHVMRLHLREMLEPTPAFREITAQIIVPVHNALTTVLARHCGLEQPDTDISRLSFAIVAMANDYCMSREFMQMLAPDVLAGADAPSRILECLVGYACALVEYEKARRAKSSKAEGKPVRSAKPASKSTSTTPPAAKHASKHVAQRATKHTTKHATKHATKRRKTTSKNPIKNGASHASSRTASPRRR
jgi:AcrR family transcriptional regulator